MNQRSDMTRLKFLQLALEGANARVDKTAYGVDATDADRCAAIADFNYVRARLKVEEDRLDAKGKP
jgi:hypothetical protein